MDGLHKFKSPILTASLLLQGVAAFLIIQATQLKSSSYLETGPLPRALRNSQMMPDYPARSREIQCSQDLAVFQWGALGCLLLSMGGIASTFWMKGRAERTTEQQEPAYHETPAIDQDMIQVYRNLKKGLDDLESCLGAQPLQVSDGMLLKNVQDNVRVIESRNQSSYDCLMIGHEEIQKASNRLARLMDQCRESANYAAAHRVDWKKNKLVDILAQMRQSFDLIVDLSKNANSAHASTIRVLGESLQGEAVLGDKISRAQEHLERIQNNAHTGNKLHDSMIAIIGESRDNLTGAGKFIHSLNQKWDQLVQMTEMIDSIAERINAQSLAASLELVRNTSQFQGVTDLFPLGTELRALAAQFHTYAKHLKDGIQDVRDEVSKTALYISQASAKADHAFLSVNQCGEYYRSNVAAVKYSASELLLLQQEVTLLIKKLQDTKAMGQAAADILTQLDKVLQTQHAFGKKVMDETSQITVHSEKISTLLARQYHELNHCQKILAQSAPSLSQSIRFATETKQSVSTLSACVDRLRVADSGNHEGPKVENPLASQLEEFRQLIASVKDSMEPAGKLRSVNRNLSLHRNPMRLTQT